MDHGWFNGLERRQREKRERRLRAQREQEENEDDTLPEIRPGSSPNASPDKLNKSASEPSFMASTHDGSFRKTATRSMVKLSEKSKKFIARQFDHSSVRTRQTLSELQKQVVRDGRLQDDVEFWGAQGAEGFRTYLLKKYGSIVAGWRALDTDKSGRLSFYEFCNACRAMGYHGNLKQLWGELDYNGNGSVSLMEIDPEVGLYMGHFKLALMNKYGNILNGWRKCIDMNGTGRVEEKEMVAAVKTLGLDVNEGIDGKKLFRMMCPAVLGLGLTLQEFDPDAYISLITGDFEGIMSQGDREFLDDMPGLGNEISMPLAAKAGGQEEGATRKWRASLVAKDRQAVKAQQHLTTKFRLGLHTADGFKAALKNRCGSLLGAWREALDLDGNGRLTYGEFTLALHRLGFHGNVQGLWRELQGNVHGNSRGSVQGNVGTGFIYFKDLDPETDENLVELKTKCEQEYGNMLLAWIKGFDTKGTGLCNEAHFVKACEKVGFAQGQPKSAKHLFKVMQPDATRKFLSLQDFDTKAFKALSRGDFRMISEREPDPKKPLDMNFHERMEAGFYYKIRRAWEAAKREEFAKACKTINVPDHLIDTKEEFQVLCIRKYGSIISAWRHVLDYDQNGRLTFPEFCQACRRLGYAGDLKKLWQKYDAKKKGWVALKDLDPEADQMVGDFLIMLATRYGTLDSAWRVGFNKDPHGSIDENELVEACTALEYPHDAHKLFKQLQPIPGRQLITIWDLDPLCTRKRQRGDVAYISEPKSPTSHPGHKLPFNLVEPPANMDELLFQSQQASTMASHNTMSMSHNTFTTSTGSFRPMTTGSGESLCFGQSTQQQQFRYVLKQKYGSTVAAWRAAFDPKLAGQCSFGKFMGVLEECAFHGNIKTLWQDLCGPDANRAMCNFRDVDIEAALVLDTVREQLIAEYGSLLVAWKKGIDAEGQGRVDELEFCANLAVMAEMGLKIKSPKKLFKMLLGHRGARSVQVQDLESFLIGLKAEEQAKTWAGSKEDSKELSSTDGNRLPSVGETVVPSPRDYVRQASLDHHAEDVVIITLADFKKRLISKYGSLFAGWRHGLDVDQNGVVTQRDFSQACNHLGIKAVQKLWAELDTNENGQISLMEWDVETAEAFTMFEKLLIDKHGNCKDGWKKSFDAKGSKSIDIQQFVTGCKSIGFTGDAERLFKLLKPESGIRNLTYQDIWLNLNPNEYRHVDEAAIHKSPMGSPSAARSPKAALARSNESGQLSPKTSPSNQSGALSPKEFKELVQQ